MRLPFAESIGRAAREILRPFLHGTASAAPARAYAWEQNYAPGLNWDCKFPSRPLTALLDDAVAKYPGHACLNFRGRRYYYREIADLVDRAARGFAKLGIQKGIKVGLMLPNSPYAIVCFYAVLKAGGTVVNINPLYAEAGIARLMLDSSACILVTLNVETLYRKVAPILEESGQVEKIVVCGMTGVLPILEKALFTLFKRHEVSEIPDDGRHLTFEQLIDNDGKMEPVDIDPERDVAVLQYTGGTTGLPKGARLTHANLYANATQVAMWGTELRPGREKILGVLPLFHANATSMAPVGVSSTKIPPFRPPRPRAGCRRR